VELVINAPTFIAREGRIMARKIMIIVAVGVFVGALAGVATAEHRGVSQQSEQGLQPSADPEFVPEGNWSGTDWQVREPVETGAIPERVFEESWMKDYGND
jgi:hypothetical protein